MTGGSSPRGRGDYLERQTRLALEKTGWLVVRAAGSHGVADLIALRADRAPLLVSCKLSGTVPKAEREALWAAHEQTGARPLVASRVHPGWVHFEQLLSDSPRDYMPVIDLKVPHRPWKPGDLSPFPDFPPEFTEE